MKSVAAVLTIGFALSMCNLTRRTYTSRPTPGTNGNNSASSSSPATEPPPPVTNQNTSVNKSITAPISGGVLNGKAISKPEPVYPAIAKQAHISGTVVVQVLVDEDGKVISAHAVSGHPLLQAASVQAARQARFAPMKLSGQTVKVTGILTYNFVEK